MNINLYTYKAKVLEVYDGDTVTLLVDLGLNVSMKIKARLIGIDTPELRQEQREEGIKSRDYLRSLILDKEVVIKTMKDKTGKYGRWLVNIYIDDIDINQHLVDSGFAKEYMR